MENKTSSRAQPHTNHSKPKLNLQKQRKQTQTKSPENSTPTQLRRNEPQKPRETRTTNNHQPPTHPLHRPTNRTTTNPAPSAATTAETGDARSRPQPKHTGTGHLLEDHGISGYLLFLFTIHNNFCISKLHSKKFSQRKGQKKKIWRHEKKLVPKKSHPNRSLPRPYNITNHN